MNCVSFPKIDQVFSLKNETLKNNGKDRKFFQSGKVGTMVLWQKSFNWCAVSSQEEFHSFCIPTKTNYMYKTRAKHKLFQGDQQ